MIRVRTTRAGWLAFMLLVAGALIQASCGKKGPPRPPLHIVPREPGALEAHQVGDRVVLAFNRPVLRTDGTLLTPGTRVDIHMAAGVVGQPDAAAIAGNPVASWSIGVESFDDYTRGARMRVPLSVETLSRTLDLPVGGASLVGRRLGFVVETVESPRRRSEPSTVAIVTICDPPVAPAGVTAQTLLEGTAVTWEPAGEGRVLIYRQGPGEGMPDRPIGESAASTGRYLDASPPVGVASEYVLRAERKPGCESGGMAATTATWLDRFPPDVPGGLVAVEEEGAIRLFWRPGGAPDIAGYHVYRAEADGPAHRVTTDPVFMTTWTDLDARSGISYTYTVTAVDRAEPPNESLPSEPARAERAGAGEDPE